MWYLFLAFIMIFLIYHYDYRNQTVGKKVWYILILLALILTAGLRYRLGIDSIRYENGYLKIPTLLELGEYDFSNTRFNVGYVTMISFARLISNNFMAMQFIQAIYVNCIIFWFFWKYAKKIFLAVFIYFVFLYLSFMCEVMRESCAVATLLLAYPYFVKSKWIQYYLLAVLAYTFHSSAIISFILPILYLPGIRSLFVVGSRTPYLMVITYMVGVVVSVAFLDYVVMLFGDMDDVQTLVNMYRRSSLIGAVLNINGIISVIFKYIIFPYMGILILRKRLNTHNVDAVRNFDHLQFMVTMCFTMAVISIPLAIFYRYNNYFFPFAIVAITKASFIPLRINRQYTRLSFYMWMILFIPLFMFQIYGYFVRIEGTDFRQIMRYYPYESRITLDKDLDREELYHYYHAW